MRLISLPLNSPRLGKLALQRSRRSHLLLEATAAHER